MQCSIHSQSGDYIVQDDDYQPSLFVLPQISCKTYCIIDASKGKSLYHKGDSEVREIASLTKIMTAYVSLQLARELNLDIMKALFNVSENAASTPGTTANLRAGQRVKIFDLLHALMLPSGNDAAVCLAENFGDRLLKSRINKNPNRAKISTPNPEKLRETKVDLIVEQAASPIAVFVKEMNRFVKVFHLKNTKFSNPHGLADKGNRSTAFDIAMLAFGCLKDPNFAEIVNKQKYESVTYVRRSWILPRTQVLQMQLT